MKAGHEIRATSPAIATVVLIAIAAAGASIAGSEVMRKTTLSVPSVPIEIGEIFMVKIADTKAHIHSDYRIKPGWTSVTASFKDDTGTTVTLTLPDVSEFDTVIGARVGIGQKYNVIITAIGNTGSATVTVSVFAR